MPTLQQWIDCVNLPVEKCNGYRAIKGLPPLTSAASQEPRCRHLGSHVGEVACASCGGSVRLKTFACEVFGACILADRKVEGTPSCVGCLQYQPVTHVTL